MKTLGCTKAQIQILLERIRDELVYEEDKRIVDEWINRIKKYSWAELDRELFSV